VRRPAIFAIVAASFVLADAGTLDDMELRSNVEASIRGTAQTAALHLKISVERAVAIPEGVVRDLNQADEVVELASKVKGVVDVDRSRLRLEFKGATDEALAARISQTVLELPQYAEAPPQVYVDLGVVTLTGTITSAAWRRELRKLCGGIEGVTEVVDNLESPKTADNRIQRALDRVFSPRATPRFPGKVRAVVKDGIVTFEGTVPRLHDKKTAERDAWSFNGVRRVDNRLELGSANAIKVVDP
jgi:osmotically-inducible protein OsmY